jgi:hypothetical protein
VLSAVSPSPDRRCVLACAARFCPQSTLCTSVRHHPRPHTGCSCALCTARSSQDVTACRVTRGIAGPSRRWRSRRCLLRRGPTMRWTWSGRETRRRKRRALGRRPPDSGVTSSGVQGVSRALSCFRSAHRALHSRLRLRRPGPRAERRTRPCSHLCDATLGGRLVDLSAFILPPVVSCQLPTLR